MPAQKVLLDTYILRSRTDHTGHFIAPHGLPKSAGPDSYVIDGVLVAIQHPNGAWVTLDTSNQYNNTFFWNDERVEGWITRENQPFSNRDVRIVIFAHWFVG